MTKVIELLDAVKKTKGIESAYALAKELGLPTQRISHYYKGSRTPDEFACMQIAKALNVSLDEVMIPVRIEAEKDEKKREAWKDYFKSIGGYAASFVMEILLSVTLIVTTTKNAEANQYVKNSILQEYKLCVYLSQIRIRVLAAWHALSTYFPHFCFSC